jgi:hypothetical protein
MNTCETLFGLGKKPVAELRRELISDGVSTDLVATRKKRDIIRDIMRVHCSRYRDCKAVGCARCDRDGTRVAPPVVISQVVCDTCDFIETLYDNGTKRCTVSPEDHFPDKDWEHPWNVGVWEDALERLSACPTHSHLYSQYG